MEVLAHSADTLYNFAFITILTVLFFQKITFC